MASFCVFAASLKIQSLSPHKLVLPSQNQQLVFLPQNPTKFIPCGKISTMMSKILTQPPAKFLYDKTTSATLIKARSSNISVIWPSTTFVAETDIFPSNVLKRVMDAIDSKGNRVTIADVGIESGLHFNQIQKVLQALSADTDGFLKVHSLSYFVA